MGIRVRVSTGGEGGILRMVGWSVGGHIAFTAALIFLPRFIPREPPPPILMTADIVSADQLQAPGGPPAPVQPARSGPTPEERARRAREAQERKKKPPEPPPEPEPEPEKTETAPEPVKPDRATPPPPGKKPEKPPEPRPAPEPEPPAAEPAAPLQQGVGLGAAGGDGASDIPSITSGAFPYHYYRSILVSNIRSRWSRPLTPGLRETLRCAVSFVISRRGRVSNVALSVPSGFPPLDESAVRAVIDSSPLPPLPNQYTSSSVRAEMIFELTPD